MGFKKGYTHKEAKERAQQICEMAKSHPDMTQEEIGRIFDIDRSRVSRILNRERKERK
jgi:DNA-directed RNA polymerase specialized sigma subunit